MNLFVKFIERVEKERILNFLLFIVGFSIPFSSAFNSISIGIFTLFSFLWFSKSKFLSIFDKKFRIYVLFILYFAVLFVGVFYSDSLSIGLKYVKKNIVFLLLAFAFFNLTDVMNYKKVRLALYGLVIGTILILLSIHINIFLKIFEEDLGFKSLFVKFVRVNFVGEGIVAIHPPYFGLLVVFCMVIVFNTNFFKKIMYNTIIKIFFLFYFLVSLYGISSFMSILLICFLFLGYLLVLVKSRKKIVLLYLLIPFLLLVLISKTFNYREAINKFPGTSLLGRIEWSFVKGKGDTSRPENWKSAILVIKDNLLLGIGSDGGINYLQKHRSERSESFKNKHNVHNQYLETLLRNGFIGLFFYLVILYCLLISSIKSKNYIYISFLFVFIIASTTESYLVRQIGITLFTFFTLLFYTHFNFFKKNTI